MIDDDSDAEFRHDAPEDDAAPPIRIAPESLAADTLRAVVESFVLREGTDYGLRETPLEDKVAQVMAQLRGGQASIVFDPATESVTIVTTDALDDSVR